MLNILIVEDEKPISDLIVLSLSPKYICEVSYDGMDAADRLLEKKYDLILLDIMLPKVNGYELMEFIRPMEIPVIFLTAMAKVEDKVKGLTKGADDYITKPFEIIELIARVETVLRRYHRMTEQIELGNISINIVSHTVKRDGREIPLTEKEFKLLVLFIENSNMALFREQIYERVWEGEFTGNSRTVDLHVQRLRKKLGLEEKLVTVQKIGYRLET